ncbi:titin homolog [Cydia splendana]|uniref:titin homolog n=1 Tax=Cydia splendana TaxID=1100963 RepID=UPI002145B5F9
MMQQQMCQPDQMGQPQQQQVMLCPVRLIYETQILVQPGEQIQPNQTLYINPQNPPPWIQNQVRPQNQVIYMQQMPSNMMPSVPQHMDQNQMYLQNLQGYYPQQMIQMDPRQMSNVVQMMPNIGQITGQNVNIGQNVINVGQNVSNIAPNVINTGQNVMPISNVVQNVQKPTNVGVNITQNQNMASIVSNDRVYNSNMPNTIPMANQNTMTNVTQTQDRTGNMNHNLVNMQKVAELQGMRQQNVRQPQVTVSPMQNVKYAPNTVDIRQIAPQNVGDIRAVNSPRPLTITSNIPNNVMQANALNKKVPIPSNPIPILPPIPPPIPIRHYNQSPYRHIQPKPRSVTPIQNQYMPSGSQTITGPRPNQSLNEVNRKRKSESPDETKRKIPNNQTVSVMETANGRTISYIPTPVRDFKLVSRNVETASTGTQANIAKEKPQVVDMKVIPPTKDNVQIESDKLVRNTVFTQAAQALNRPLIRTEPQPVQPDVVIRIEKLHSPTKITPTEPMKFVTSEGNTEPLKPETSKPNTEIVRIETAKSIAELPKMETSRLNIELLKIGPSASVKEPLVIDTPAPSSIPFVLSASIDEQKPNTNKTPQPNKQEIQSKTEKKTKAKSLEMTTSRTPEPKTPKRTTETPKIETITKPEQHIEKPIIETVTKPKEVTKAKVKKEETPKSKTNIKDEKTVEVKKPEVETKPAKVEAKEVKEVNRKFTVTSINDFKGSELQIANGSVRKEDTDHYILTHVLDGYVIQESNTAFPIRKPLKEKIIYQNADLSLEPKREETYKHRTEDGKLIKDNSKILSISDLNLNEDDAIESEAETVKCNEEREKSEDTKIISEEKCDEDSDQPFANLTPSAIKSWTVDQLASHLSKFDWAETISVLSEHEIDGESLFLVNKQQLVQIGVSEMHADVICEYIKNS